MIGIIWYTDKAKGIREFNRILENYELCGIEPANSRAIKAERNTSTATFKNGDIWRLVRASDSSRGYRCNVAYIPKGIAEEYLNLIIMPATTMHPFTAFHYY